MSEVLATVGVGPVMFTAPPFTRICPAALRLTVMLLSSESPNTVSRPLGGMKDAATAKYFRDSRVSR
jgi:hypothetical protein